MARIHHYHDRFHSAYFNYGEDFSVTTKCTGLMGRIFGHKFRPVITLSATTFDSTGVQSKAHVVLEMADKYRDENYHGCICQRCGAVTGDKP